MWSRSFICTVPASSKPPRMTKVAFRLDDVAGWLHKVQEHVITQFGKEKIPLTPCVIADSCGGAPHMPFLASLPKEGESRVDFACHGWAHESFPGREDQLELLTKCKGAIEDRLGGECTVFVPPNNAWDEDTLVALKKSGYTVLSASQKKDIPAEETELRHFPVGAWTGEMIGKHGEFEPLAPDVVVAAIRKQVETKGYAAVMMHPQDFAVDDGRGGKKNEVNEDAVDGLLQIFAMVREMGVEFCLLRELS